MSFSQFMIEVPPWVRLGLAIGISLGITGVGFLFLLAFALGNFWSNNQDLRQAVLPPGIRATAR